MFIGKNEDPRTFLGSLTMAISFLRLISTLLYNGHFGKACSIEGQTMYFGSECSTHAYEGNVVHI